MTRDPTSNPPTEVTAQGSGSGLIDQTILAINNHGEDGAGIPGNCLQACVATIFGYRLEDVPHFADASRHPDDGRWWWCLVGWCQEAGVRVEMVEPVQAQEGWAIWAGPSPRGPYGHVVVAYNGSVYHDPHPSRAGLVKVDRAYVFRTEQGARP